MTEPFRIAIAGLGTVGCGVIKTLCNQSDLITKRAGRPIEIVAINARDKSRDRGHDLSIFHWVDDAVSMANMDGLDCIVEMIGGADGVAKTLVEQSFVNKKHVVTANKALLADHGFDLAQRAETANKQLFYEAAVAGGIPVIKTVGEGLSGNKINAIYGILNGTCNYILTEMREGQRDFSEVLKEAQALGYAEADPSFDVGGIDAAHKVALLAALGFGRKPDFKSIDITGIEGVSLRDIVFADELGYRIKLIGIAKKLGNHIYQSVAPCLVPKSSFLGSVEGVFNATMIEADPVDKIMLQGRGAGEGPTASAVVADIIDLAKGIERPVFGIETQYLTPIKKANPVEIKCKHYLHLRVKDQPGVIADISAILKDDAISIESMVQRGQNPVGSVSVVMVTHSCSVADMDRAADKIAALNALHAKPTLFRIEDL